MKRLNQYPGKSPSVKPDRQVNRTLRTKEVGQHILFHLLIFTIQNADMETQFYIVFSLKTLRGHEPFAKYFIGNSREHARTIFGKLQGTDHADEANLLHLEFMEVQDGLPVNLNVLTCSLNQMAENCKIITKELFKLVNLEIKGGSSIP